MLPQQPACSTKTGTSSPGQRLPSLSGVSMGINIFTPIWRAIRGGLSRCRPGHRSRPQGPRIIVRKILSPERQFPRVLRSGGENLRCVLWTRDYIEGIDRTLRRRLHALLLRGEQEHAGHSFRGATRACGYCTLYMAGGFAAIKDVPNECYREGTLGGAAARTEGC